MVFHFCSSVLSCTLRSLTSLLQHGSSDLYIHILFSYNASLPGCSKCLDPFSWVYVPSVATNNYCITSSTSATQLLVSQKSRDEKHYMNMVSLFRCRIWTSFEYWISESSHWCTSPVGSSPTSLYSSSSSLSSCNTPLSSGREIEAMVVVELRLYYPCETSVHVRGIKDDHADTQPMPDAIL